MHHRKRLQPCPQGGRRAPKVRSACLTADGPPLALARRFLQLDPIIRKVLLLVVERRRAAVGMLSFVLVIRRRHHVPQGRSHRPKINPEESLLT